MLSRNGKSCLSLHRRHNDHDGVSNHQPHGSLLNRLFRRRSKKTSKLRVTGLCVGNSPGPVNSPHKGPVTRKNVSIWWRHHDTVLYLESQIAWHFSVLNSLRPSDAYYLNQCWNIVNWTPGNKLQWTFKSKSMHFYSRKCIWNCCLQNGVYFVSASMC